MLDSGLVVDSIATNFADHHGEYRPLERSVENIPKSNFTIRYGLESGLPDRVLYHSLVAELAPYFDPMIPWFVFSHRCDPHRSDGRYLFRRSIPSWQDFVGTVRTEVKFDKYLLSTDVTNYFENINLEELKSIFSFLLPNIDADPGTKVVIRTKIATLFSCLESWCYQPGRGLPQNRDASSFLANVYMNSVDSKMQQLGWRYFRYMDDIKGTSKNSCRLS